MLPRRTFSLKEKSDKEKRKPGRRLSSVPEAVAEAIAAMTDQLRSGELKPTVAEFVRLLDLQRELLAEDIRHIKVTWVDSSSGTESTTEV